MLEGILRESIDKHSTKGLRRDGYLIANIYGKGLENINAAFKKNEFMKFVKTKPSLKFKVKVGGKEHEVIIHDYQKDPVTSDLLHVDLRVLNYGEVSQFLVPVKTKGTPIGLKNKGVLITSKRRLKVKCKPENLPDAFTVDVSALDVGDTILVRQVEPLEGVTIKHPGSDAVVGVMKSK
jgi:large subunit ribosomal protein L25